MRVYRTVDTKGKIGEDALRTWANQVGLVVNKSVDDRAGWDYILESAPEAGHEVPSNLFEHRDSYPLRARIQVKATDKRDGVIDVKLSNWLRMVEDPNPAFFFVAELDGKEIPQRVYLVHVGEEHWREVLYRRRENEVGKKKPLHRLRLRLHYTQGQLLDNLNGEGLLDSISAAIRSPRSAYSEKKLRTIQSIGFEEGNASVRLVLPNEDSATPLSLLADLEIGVKDNIPFAKAEIHPARFGLADDVPALTIDGGALASLPPKPRAPVEVRFAAHPTGEEIRFNAQLYASAALAIALEMGRSLEGLAIRVTAPFFEAVARWGGKSTFWYHTPQPDKAVSLQDLRTVARLTRLHVHAAQANADVELEVMHNGTRVVLLGGRLPVPAASPEEMKKQLDFSELIETAWSLARRFEVDNHTRISMADLARNRDAIEAISEIVSGGSAGELAFSWNPQAAEVNDLKDHARDVVLATEIILGDQRLIAALHLDGELELSKKENGGRTLYRVAYSGTDCNIFQAVRADQTGPEIGSFAMRSVRRLGRKALIVANPVEMPTG